MVHCCAVLLLYFYCFVEDWQQCRTIMRDEDGVESRMHESSIETGPHTVPLSWYRTANHNPRGGGISVIGGIFVK